MAATYGNDAGDRQRSGSSTVFKFARWHLNARELKTEITKQRSENHPFVITTEWRQAASYVSEKTRERKKRAKGAKEKQEERARGNHVRVSCETENRNKRWRERRVLAELGSSFFP
ncbi:hypothetical protein Ahy_A04g021648 isoform B [Arachis hypogaea]|uniref:Uncharacterized protein n=1 Tax=Arachis hypogaea TaxID=3818 RepID=A0A445DLF8_ARAHY|nr:hypothetical protein Ahy_A04g021648 isoform B [Arachis hypogaea]